MKTQTRILALAIAFSLPLAACVTPQSKAASVAEQARIAQAADEAARAEIAAVLESYSNEIMAKNLPGMEAYVLADDMDFTIFEGKGANLGWADYRDNHLEPEFANDDLVFNAYRYFDVSSQVSGGLATATFSIEVDYVYKGEAVSQTRRGTAVLNKVGDDWKIAHLHTS